MLGNGDVFQVRKCETNTHWSTATSASLMLIGMNAEQILVRLVAFGCSFICSRPICLAAANLGTGLLCALFFSLDCWN